MKRVLVIAVTTIVVLLVLLIVAAYGAFPVFRYLSRVRDPAAAKHSGDALARLRGETVVAVTGHPDDAEVYVGGLLALLDRNGNRVVLIVGTSGEKGGNGIPNLAQVREGEQRRAGEILGYDRIVFARNPDRGLENNAHFRRQIREVFEQEQPTVLVTFDAESQSLPYRHPDHAAAGAASLAVAKQFPTVREAYLFSTATPNVLVEVAPYVELKVRAREAHKSQGMGNTRTRQLLSVLRYLPGLFSGNMRSGFTNPYPEVGIESGESYRLLKLSHAR